MRTERRDHARVALASPSAANIGAASIALEVRAHRLERRPVVVAAQPLDERPVADPEAEHEALVEGGVERAAAFAAATASRAQMLAMPVAITSRDVR